MYLILKIFCGTPGKHYKIWSNSGTLEYNITIKIFFLTPWTVVLPFFPAANFFLLLKKIFFCQLFLWNCLCSTDRSHPYWIWPFFFPLSFSLLAVAVIKASELWAAMEPELLVTVRTELEPTSDAEKEQQQQEDDSDDKVEEEEEEEDDRATAVKIAQYLRVNKYRWCWSSVLALGKSWLNCHYLKDHFLPYCQLAKNVICGNFSCLCFCTGMLCVFV